MIFRFGGVRKILKPVKVGDLFAGGRLPRYIRKVLVEEIREIPCTGKDLRAVALLPQSNVPMKLGNLIFRAVVGNKLGLALPSGDHCSKTLRDCLPLGLVRSAFHTRFNGRPDGGLHLMGSPTKFVCKMPGKVLHECVFFARPNADVGETKSVSHPKVLR